MTIVLIAAVVVVIAVAAYFAARLARTAVPVATQAEIDARQLDEGMIVGDPIPIGTADDVGVVTVVPTDAAASAAAEDFAESTGPVEPAPPRSVTPAVGGTPPVNAVDASGSARAADAAAAVDGAAPSPTAGAAPASSAGATPSPTAGATPPASAGAAPQPTAGATPAATLTPRRHDIRWARRFEPPDASFDDATRLSLLKDLGIVRAPWGVPLLAQAYEEEPGVEHRRAALRSLAAYRHPDTQATFDVALHSDDDDERTIAEHALTALQIRAALPS